MVAAHREIADASDALGPVFDSVHDLGVEARIGADGRKGGILKPGFFGEDSLEFFDLNLTQGGGSVLIPETGPSRGIFGTLAVRFDMMPGGEIVDFGDFEFHLSKITEVFEEVFCRGLVCGFGSS